MYMQTNLVPAHTAIVFDLNGVILRFGLWPALCRAWRSDARYQLLRAALNPVIIWQVLKLYARGTVVEKAILATGAKYPYLQNLVPLLLEIANSQLPVTDTLNLVRELKQAGFKVYLFSNSGAQSIQLLQNQYPHIFVLFDGICFASAQDRYLQKPHPLAFAKFLKQFNLNKSQMILIDDQKRNIQAAQQLEIRAIHFRNSAQCRAQLKNLTIL